MNRGLPFRGDLLRWRCCRNGGNHHGDNATLGGRHWIYYQQFSFPFPATGYRQLTLHNDVLTHLLVPLTVATGLVGQAIALMVEGLAALTTRDILSQLALDKWQSVPGRRKKEKI